MNSPHPLSARRQLAKHSVILKIAVLLLTIFSTLQVCRAQEVVVVPFNQSWKYEQSNLDLGTAWREPGFDDSRPGWGTGIGPLGFPVGETLFTSGLTIQTVLNRTTNGVQPRTYYFRTTFTFNGDPSGVALVATNLIDDAAVFFLNGVELARVAFPPPPTDIVYTSEGSRAASDVATYGYDVWTNSAPNLVQGVNTYAVEVHQTGGGSSDLVFATRLAALIPTPVSITVQPTNMTVAENRVVNLTVGATGIPAPSFQWYRDSLPIDAATSRTYTISNTVVADTGNYFVIVSNLLNVVTSSVARLTVVIDTNGPVLLSAKGDASFSRIILNWDELMPIDAAEEEGNYHLFAADGSEILNAFTLATLANGTNVVLDLATPLVLNGVYSLEIDFQIDLVGNASAKVGNPIFDTLSGIVTAVRPFVLSPGFALKELYLGLSASSVAIADLRSSPNNPNSPDLVRYGQLLELNTFDEFEGYGARISGVLIPPVSGDYIFYLAADDNGELWLSTDANPANIVNIANEPVWANRREWTGAGGGGGRVGVPSPSGGPQANISGPISLVAGQMYYFETLVKEGGGGDNLALAWQIPGGPAPLNGDSPIPGTYMAALADPVGASITITQQPLDKIFPGSTIPFSVDFNSNDGGFTANTPVSYEGPWIYNAGTGSWRQDGQGAENNRPNTSRLNSPSLVVRSAGNVVLTFAHRYSFETGDWDGGQVRISVNGGPFTVVPGTAFTQNGYNGTVLVGSASVLTGQEAFVLESAGHGSGAMITSVADLGAFNAGDTIRVQFIAASDTNTRGAIPNWEIDTVASPLLDFFLGNPDTSVTFSVGDTASNSEGASPTRGYQWFRNDGAGFVLIPGANSAAYTLVPHPSDDGAQFRVTIDIPGASATSGTATLTVGSAGSRIHAARQANGQLVISWTGQSCLQETTTLNGAIIPWGASPVVNGVPFTPGAGNRFYRLTSICP